MALREGGTAKKIIHGLLMITEMAERVKRIAPGQRRNTGVLDNRQAGLMRRNEG